jgi:hypothetical protein
MKQRDGTGAIRDSARPRPIATRKSIVEVLMGIAKTPEAPGRDRPGR